MLNTQLDRLLDIVRSIESTLSARYRASINVKAYVNSFRNNQKLNDTLMELRDAEAAYLKSLRDIRDRIMQEINL
jgi:hypothetical protein